MTEAVQSLRARVIARFSRAAKFSRALQKRVALSHGSRLACLPLPRSCAQGTTNTPICEGIGVGVSIISPLDFFSLDQDIAAV